MLCKDKTLPRHKYNVKSIMELIFHLQMRKYRLIKRGQVNSYVCRAILDSYSRYAAPRDLDTSLVT
jgi:hypothetical protein